jgi:Pyruvate/2-oxoacid:ferredoxin oxidoreductase delta subunit
LSPCARCGSPLELGDLRCAICAEVAPEGTQATTESVEETVAAVMRCEGCGAAARYSAQARGLLCAFCASVMHREEIVDPMERAGSYLTFSVDEGEARATLRRWLGSLGWFRPPDLLSQARIESLRPLWWVGWVFDAQALVSWTADSDAGARRSSWAPHSGQVAMNFDDVVVSASRGLTDVEAYHLVPSYDLRLADETPTAPEGASAEPVIEEFDVQRSQARARVLAAIEDHATARVKAEEVPGVDRRNVHTVCLLRGLDTRRAAFPAWVMAYRYGDRLFRVVICGQDAQSMMGKAPWSWGRIGAVALAVVSAVALALFLSTL